MTNRSSSLLMLYVAGVIVSSVLLAAIVPVAIRWQLSTPWLMPAVAIVCLSTVLFAGRRFVLPRWMGESAVRTISTLVAVTAVSMLAAYGMSWGVQALAGGRAPGAGITLVLWYCGLWLAMHALNRGVAAGRGGTGSAAP